MNYDQDNDTFNADAYRVDHYSGIAFSVLGWETKPDEDTEWSGYEARTGNVVAMMVGDDHYFSFDPEEVHALPREDYCGICGQIGCGHDGLDRS